MVHFSQKLTIFRVIAMDKNNSRDFNEWLRRIVPLPKTISIKEIRLLNTYEIGVVHQLILSPPIQTACNLLSKFAQSKDANPRFSIRLVLNEAGKTIISDFPRNDQAYAIEPQEDGLLLIGNTTVGLLYAALTLSKIIGEPRGTEVRTPIMQVMDFPDISERGQWGGNSASDINWTHQWKLNVVESSAGLGIDKNGKAYASISRDLIQQGKELGVKIVPFIPHLEQIAQGSGIVNRKDIISTPDPSKPLPSDYTPGLCMSSQATTELIGEWLAEIARIAGVSDIMVWLSEDRAPCFCEKCLGKEPFALEVKCIVKAFEKAKEVNPAIHLRILLTQGSYAVNDKVLEAVPEDVGVTYYDGGRTYDSSHNPMIYPLLEEYASKGRWLGVYPQLTNAWRSVFPWTAPQFIQYRATEFADKHLSCVIGYVVPSNRFFEFNVTAWGEWAWNSEGRTPEEFAKAYATVNRICDPDIFAEWALKAGETGWVLAESRLFLHLIYDPALGMRGERPFDMRFQESDLIDPENPKSLISIAREAVELAHKAGLSDMIDESEAVLAAINVLPTLRDISAIRLKANTNPETSDKDRLEFALSRLDLCASVIQTRLMRWGKRICSKDGSSLPSRLRDTANVLLRTCDIGWELADSMSINNPNPQYRVKTLYSWDAKDFESSPSVKLNFDITEIVNRNFGSYDITFTYDGGAYGTDVDRIAVFREDILLSEGQDIKVRASIWERWHEMRIEIPEIPVDSRIFLTIELTGIPADAPKDRRTCSGSIGIRKAYEENDILELWWR
jgi:hypothetical protein